MEIKDSKTIYEAPRAKVVDVKSWSILCSSPHGENTEGFSTGEHFGESDWE